MARRLWILLLTFGLGFFWNPAAQAALTVDVTKSVSSALPIAIPSFGPGLPGQPSVADVIRSDLSHSGLFRVLAPGSYPGDPHQPIEVKASSWSGIGATGLAIGDTQKEANGNYVVQVYVYNVQTGQELAARRYTCSPAELHMTAHHVADLIYKTFTGKAGPFAARIAYVRQIGNEYTLLVAESDGWNPHPVVRGRMPVFSPVWSPDNRRLAYVTYHDARAIIYVQDLATGQRQAVAPAGEIVSAPAFSPDGRELAYARAEGGATNIFVVDLATGQRRQLTHGSAINTSPSWAPDGRHLVFVSDRAGSPQIYSMDSDGGDVHRLTFSGNYNASPVYSPTGQDIAFIHRTDGVYALAVMRADGSGMRVLDAQGNCDHPSFAGNGQMILYGTQRGGRKVLAEASVDGKTLAVLRGTAGEDSQPAWSH
ncbi:MULTISPECIES: Tol-Pal system beta propeller repeat protein TolB [Acidithiobacillus]|jgi:TolB protein|uniref:Tol-Pal system protein TolB n=4 Tax=Acidithiobacillus caldus TaxID=33059 RepID=F9ZTW4_ACICS|nr:MULTISPECIES: Tol-Pal system beta propeller repeat protein TolB [Acidithiobacillus]AEK59448.1 tolB protein precursor, periplasmic protein involved in the tonb-independent uptake of group A colicins [Acidithiobacillus caldus SM-1]AIA56491.1 TolB protein precursor [Acidithiobacillus caldus ATCC 51756]AUW33814.1 Tol-Pal system beta propeller repeat protein TolB [Acidithiobacillus caldus]MBU2735543.1 Tol-Pal system beta propeller repeat protein TolB [Acidithiobacillus caldus ATCC 51756]MBU27447